MKLLITIVILCAVCTRDVYGFQKGMSYLTWGNPTLNSDASRLSVNNLEATRTEWIALIVTWFQDTINSTTIKAQPGVTYTDEELADFLLGTLAMGYKIFLKPHVDPRDGNWRALIGSEFKTAGEWAAWWKSYREYILIYAEIAQAFKLPLFSVGTEMITASAHEAEFRTLIADVRRIYSGNVTYAANWGTQYQLTGEADPSSEAIFGEIDQIKFIDALDIIGVDAYYYLTDNQNPSKEELVKAWEPIKVHLANISDTYKKPIIFTEIGYRSIQGSAVHPGWWNGTAPLNATQQAVCYDAVFNVFQGEEWWEGVYWWNWDANPNAGGDKDDGFTPQNKPAEALITKYYSDESRFVKKQK